MRKALLPLATSMLFAGSYIGGKYTTLDLGPLTTTLLRYFIALLFLACLLPHYRLCSLKLAGRDFLPMLGLGLTGVVGYHYFFFSSLRYTDVANTGIINALSPAVTGIAAAILIGERLSARSYAGVVLACIGVLVLLSNGDPEVLLRTDFNRGDVLMLIAVLCWTAYALLVKTLATQYSSYTLTFYATFVRSAVHDRHGPAPKTRCATSAPFRRSRCFR